MRLLLPLVLLTAGCGGDAPRNAAEITNMSADEIPAAETDAREESARDQTGAAQPKAIAVGPLQIPYDAALLVPMPAKVALPPDWQREVDGLKLLGRDRAELVGKAECLYGQSGEASRCNVQQEAGLSFASLDISFAELSARLPGEQRKPISLAGAEGVSWEIGAEGEGAEYILLPASPGSVLIVRQFRTSGNPDEAAVRTVLSDMLLKNGG